MTTDTLINDLEHVDPARSATSRSVDAAWSEVHASITQSTMSRSPRRHVRTFVLSGVAALLVGVVVFQALPAPVSRPTSASAATFLRNAARTVVRAAPLSASSLATPLPNQYVLSENEGPDGTTWKTWLSVTGAGEGLDQWTGLTGNAPSSGQNSYAACTVAQAEATGCFPEAGFYPDMPTDPTALLAYLNEIGVTNTDDPPSPEPSGWEDNDIAKATSYLMATTYLLPTQYAALFNLMAQTPGFTIMPNVTDAIGRTGEGVEWDFEGSSGVLIFDPTTYAYLGTRTWPGMPNFSAPYDGDALVGISLVNSIPAT